MMKSGKLAALRLAESTGFSKLLYGSAWRQRRLLILCYHGVSKSDEHEWCNLYVSPDTFRGRMKCIAESGCNVLPLPEAIRRLEDGTLPPRAVALTFDDGFHDFYSLAFPIVESFGFPVTVYLTTYYMDYNRPVFDPMVSYLLWLGRNKQLLEWPEIFPGSISLDEAGRQRATSTIQNFALKRKLSGREKDGVLSELASRLGLDYEELCRRRVMHLITAEEGRELAARGVNFEYHTHRHRLHARKERMFQELEDNRSRILSISEHEPHHFCYTGGYYLPEHPGVLKDYGIVSATTCEPGICSQKTSPLLLPRLVDTPGLTELEFRSWLTGTAALLPKRAYRMSEGQLAEDGELAPA